MYLRSVYEVNHKLYKITSRNNCKSFFSISTDSHNIVGSYLSVLRMCNRGFRVESANILRLEVYLLYPGYMFQVAPCFEALFNTDLRKHLILQVRTGTIYIQGYE